MAIPRNDSHPVTSARHGLLLARRDKLLLFACAVGLLAVWFFYAAFGAASGGAAGPEAVLAPAATATSTQMPATPGLPAAPAAAATAGPSLTPSQEPVRPVPASSPVVPSPAAAVPQRIVYPAAGMDVVVHPLQPSQGEAATQNIVPPETLDGYWLAPFGIPGAGSTNTTYVVGHSWEGLDAPFNRLSTMAAPGDELTVHTKTGDIQYKVDSVTTYLKSTLKDSPIWAVVPNRLVMISCYTGDLWGKNVAVVASPVAAR